MTGSTCLISYIAAALQSWLFGYYFILSIFCFYIPGPFVPRKLSVKVEKSNFALLVSWRKPLSKPERCQLQLWHPGQSIMLQHHTLAQWQIQHVFQGLVPGRNYSICLSCIAGPYKASSETVTVPLGGYLLVLMEAPTLVPILTRHHPNHNQAQADRKELCSVR